MSWFAPQNPGIGGLDELTPAEESFLTSLAGLPYSNGDILYYSGSNLTNLGVGSDGEVLMSSSGVPVWSDDADIVAVWGNIGGTLSDQTDLQTALDAKVDVAGDTMTGGLGIGGAVGTELLGVTDGSVLFKGTTGATPASGIGSRLMWIPSEAAFRAGQIDAANPDAWDAANIGYASFAVGRNTEVSGDNSAAFGLNHTLSGGNAAVFGSGNTVSGNNAVAAGSGITTAGVASALFGTNHTEASGLGNLAVGTAHIMGGNYNAVTGWGNNLTASGQGNFCGGLFNTISNSAAYTLVSGLFNNVSGTLAVAIGNQIVIGTGGGNSVAFGTSINVSLANSISLGSQITNGGQFSTAIGRGVTTSNTAGTAVGAYIELASPTNYSVAVGSWLKSTANYNATFGVGWDAGAGNEFLNDVTGALMFGMWSTIPTITMLPNAGAGGVGTVGHVGFGTKTPSYSYVATFADDVLFQGDVAIQTDNGTVLFGAGDDAGISYDGTNLVIDPKLVGSGVLSVLGDISILDEDIILGTTTGTKIGTATSQKLGFWNAAPVIQQTGDIIDALATIGAVASPILSYGNMHAYNLGTSATSVTVSVVDTWYEVGAGLSGGPTSGFTFQNSKELKCTTAGTYKLTWKMSVETTAASQEVEGAIMKNGTADTSFASHCELTIANRPQNMSGCGIVTLAVNDLVSLAVLNHTGTQDIVVDHASLTVNRIA